MGFDTFFGYLNQVECSHSRIADEALRWLDEKRQKPFFLCLAVTIPHANNEARAGTGDGHEVLIPELPRIPLTQRTSGE